MKFSSFSVIFLSATLLGCTVTAPVQQVRIDYLSTYVPQESGFKFSRITDDLDNLRNMGSNIKDLVGQQMGFKLFDIDKLESKIMYISKQENSNRSFDFNLFLKKIDNLKLKQQRTFQDNVWDPAFSPDGQNIAYVDERNGAWNIFMVGSEKGAMVRQITQSKTNSCYLPEFFPDASKILFVQDEKVGENVVRTVQGNGAVVNSSVNVYEQFLWSFDMVNSSIVQYGRGSAPSFFPDGKQLVCIRKNKNLSELWLLDIVDGKEFNLYTDDKSGLYQPRVSPDGKKIAFVKSTKEPNSPENLDIFVINSDGTELIQITYHKGHDFNPVWSADGNSLYFVSQRGSEKGTYNIWKLGIN
jgi:Tol biopolymer transport system component